MNISADAENPLAIRKNRVIVEASAKTLMDASPLVRSLRPLLALAALVLLALPARAGFVLDDGQGHAKPTGGVAASGSGQQHSVNPYGLGSDGYYGGNAGGPSSTCSGNVH